MCPRLLGIASSPTVLTDLTYCMSGLSITVAYAMADLEGAQQALYFLQHILYQNA